MHNPLNFSGETLSSDRSWLIPLTSRDGSSGVLHFQNHRPPVCRWPTVGKAPADPDNMVLQRMFAEVRPSQPQCNPARTVGPLLLTIVLRNLRLGNTQKSLLEGFRIQNVFYAHKVAPCVDRLTD